MVSAIMQSTKGDLLVGPTAKPLHSASLFVGVDSCECLVEASSPIHHSTDGLLFPRQPQLSFATAPTVIRKTNRRVTSGNYFLYLPFHLTYAGF